MIYYTKKFQTGGPVPVPKRRSSEVKEHSSRLSYDLRPSMKKRKDTPEEIAYQREMRILASENAKSVPWSKDAWRDKLAMETSAIGDKLSLQQLPVIGKYIPNILDATAGFGHMASALGAAPLQAQESNSIKPYLYAVGTPLAVGAMAGIGTKSTGEFASNVLSPIPIPRGTRVKIENILRKKILPGVKTRVLPDKLVQDVDLLPEVGGAKPRIKVMLKDKKGDVKAYLDLEEKPNWIKNADGTIAADKDFKPMRAATEWYRPMNIRVNEELRGNRAQDVLYQMGINETKKKGFKGVVSGEDLISPEKTVKAHARFNREILGSKASLVSNTNSYLRHDIVGLTDHINENVISDWFKEYSKIDKFSPRPFYSVKDIKNVVSPYTREIPKLPIKTPLTSGVIYNLLGKKEQK